MRLSTVLATLTALGWLFCGPAIAQTAAVPSLPEIEKQLGARWDAVPSLTATVNVQVLIAACFPKVPLQGTLTGTGALNYLRKDGKELGRVDLVADLAEGARVGRVTGVMNGTRAFFESELLGSIQTEEASPPTPEKGAAAPGGRSLFQALHAHFNLASKGRQAVGGKDAYVIEGRPKDAAGASPLAGLRVFLDPDTGVVLKAVGFDAQGGALGVLNVSNIRVNVPLSAAQFAEAPSPPSSGLADVTASARSSLEDLTNQVKERFAR